MESNTWSFLVGPAKVKALKSILITEGSQQLKLSLFLIMVMD